MRLAVLVSEASRLYTGDGGSDEIEWKAWLEMGAASVVPPTEAQQARKRGAMVIPKRWVRTDKSDSPTKVAPKSLVVQGFKDRALGQYRRDATTASSLGDARLTCVCGQRLLASIRGYQK